MIQTPILDNALQATKDPGPSTNYPPTKRPSASGSASSLKDRIESQRNSQALSIVDLFIGDEGAYEIAKFLKQNKEFSSIQLRGNNISAAGFEAICQALKGFNRLRDITAEWNNIGSDISGLVALHQLLKNNNSVEVVDLKNNRLGPSSGRVVGDIIRDSNTLKKIDLRWNELGSEGGQAILKALQESNRLVTVDLSGNKIPEEILVQIDEVSSSKTVTRITASVPQTTQKSFGQTQVFATPSVENKTSAQEIKPRFSNSAFPAKYGNTKPYGSALRQATPPRESHQHTTQQTLSVNTNLHERPVQRSNALGAVSENTRKYSYLTENKSYNAAPNVTYSSPKRRMLDRHDGNVDDIVDRIEATKQNIERFSPKQHDSKKENFRYDPPSRSTFDLKQELSRRGPELNSTYKYRQIQMTPGVTDTLRRSVNVRSEVKDIHVRHEADEGNLKVGKLISDLERMLEKEQIRAIEAEARFNALANDFEMEQVIKQDLEKKHSHILDELRRRDSEVNELRAALDDFERENISLKADVNRLNIENERLDQFNKVGLADLEDKYIHQLKQADAHSHSLRIQLDNVQQDLNGQLLDLRRELDDRCRNYEDQILEFSKMNDELSAELASQLEFIEKIKVEHEENLRRTVIQVREEEIQKAQIVIRDLEGQLAGIRLVNEELTARNAEMLQDLQNYEKQIREQHIQFANELARLGAELDRLRAELNNANGIIQKQNSELAARDSAIHQLHGDIERLRTEIQRLTDAHVLQIENMRRDFDGERRRFADSERQLIMNIEDLERRLVESQNETIVITKEYDRLVEIIKGNVTKAIHDTFVSHKNTSEIRHIEHRTTAVSRPLFK